AVLRDVTIELGPGLAVLRGLNGAGKTTLLRAIAGLVPLSRGRRAVTSAPLYLGHRSMLLRGLTPRENLTFLAAFRGRADADVVGALRWWGLAEVMDRPIERLSAGQRRRASLARLGTELEPFVLLDEPFADLDVDAVMLVLLESLTFGPGRAREPDIASAMYWIAVLFATVLVAGRAFDREIEDDAIDAVVVLPGGREALYAGKAIALFFVTLVVALAAGAFAIFLFDLDVVLPLHLALVTLLGVLALPPVVTLVSLLALRVRARVALVPILAFPMLVPQLVAATSGASAALAGDAVTAL